MGAGVFRKQQVAAEVHRLSPSHFQLLLQASELLLEQRPQTQMQPEERSQHHVVCQLFMDHSLQFSNQSEAFIYALSFHCLRSTHLK